MVSIIQFDQQSAELLVFFFITDELCSQFCFDIMPAIEYFSLELVCWSLWRFSATVEQGFIAIKSEILRKLAAVLFRPCSADDCWFLIVLRSLAKLDWSPLFIGEDAAISGFTGKLRCLIKFCCKRFPISWSPAANKYNSWILFF